MNKKNIILFLMLLSTFFFFSACSSSEECPQDTTYEKFSYDEDLDKCVSKIIDKDVCGNGVVEEGEDSCNCPKDVSKTDKKYGCSGVLGDYLEKSCNSKKECVYSQNDKVIEETKSIQFKNSDLTFDLRATLNNPYILNVEDNNSIEFEITLFKFGNSEKNYKNIIIKELKIEDSSSVILGNIEYNENLESIDSKTTLQKIELKDIDKYEAKESLKIKLIVSYLVETLDGGQVTKTENKIETLTSSLGRITIINPNFYEKN